ncbi:MAG: tetratricopeptide repeat protein [Pirellula sp.]
MLYATIVVLCLSVTFANGADVTFGPGATQNTTSGFETSIDDATRSQTLQLFSSKGVAGAREYLKKQLATNNDLPHHDLLMSDWLIQSGRMPEAVQILEQLAADSPPRKDIHYTFAWIALGQGRVFDAATHVEQIQKLPFESKWSDGYRKQFTTSVRELQAKIAERRGEWKTAFELFSSLIATKPGSVSIRFGLAKSAFHTNNLDLAQKNLRLLEQAQKPLVLAEVVIAKWYDEVGDIKATEEWFRKSLQRGDPEAATKEYAMWMLREGRPTEVGNLIAGLSTDSQNRPDFKLLNVKAVQMIGDFSKTIPVLRELINADESQKAAKLHLVWALSDSDQVEERRNAISVAKSLLEQVDASNQVAIATLAWAYHKAGEQESAIDTLRNLNSNNLDRDIAFFVACIQESRGEKDLSRALYDAIIKSNGEFYHTTRMPQN